MNPYAFPHWDGPSGQCHNGMSLRDYFIAHAPAKEIEGMAPETVGESAAFLGMAPHEYDGKKHWPIILARLRCQWADAMIAERDKP